MVQAKSAHGAMLFCFSGFAVDTDAPRQSSKKRPLVVPAVGRAVPEAAPSRLAVEVSHWHRYITAEGECVPRSARPTQTSSMVSLRPANTAIREVRSLRRAGRSTKTHLAVS
ncbi:hypothetical protein BAUCODRAFT_333256 [Baudoinia panamericana UAMH 10762]|uniref:Uncharacterized protein n=1 Tax=Baudoinia panamericana (strain UAMH 10762) TaxID=717646 RepID=M2MWQ5_BAUPA|nr:uncharacterized protein BAUCODRAFT_333256 [Baudoinia panamericana UAMH 10762]EMC91024.1 hypothetical protein BAUCODRAFT_333256 [Baudoinia panamericana UAMH 10762]